MTLLLDEIALATARLAEAGVDSPRADAEIIAAHVHNVKRSELHTVPDSGVRRPVLGGYRPPGEPRAPPAHHRAGVLQVPRS